MLRSFLSALSLLPCLTLSAQTLVIYDEFDSTRLNTKIWNTQMDWGPNISMEQDEQIYTPKNVFTENGKLKLILKNEPGCYDTWRFCDSTNCTTDCGKNFKDPNCTGSVRCERQGDHCLCLVPKHFKYTAGMIASRQKCHYGVFEIKCKIPQDSWPAFWMFGDCCSEIDVFEFLGCEEDKASITIHKCHDKACTHKLNCGHNFNELKDPPKFDFSKDFYTWKLDWKPEGLSVYVENKLIYHCNSDGFGACLYNTLNLTGGSCTIGTHTLYPNGNMQLIVNLATNPNKCLPGASPMEIEYIKVWQY